jgi:hypothetical protein
MEIKVSELLADTSFSSANLSHHKLNNPKKYELFIKGIVASYLNLNVDDLINYHNIKKSLL